jgi:hypothetical protein
MHSGHCPVARRESQLKSGLKELFETLVSVRLATAFRGCGKTPKLLFRGRELPKESVFFLMLVKKQIPRCARDDKIGDFFRSLFWPASG